MTILASVLSVANTILLAFLVLGVYRMAYELWVLRMEFTSPTNVTVEEVGHHSPKKSADSATVSVSEQVQAQPSPASEKQKISGNNIRNFHEYHTRRK